jgi:DNA polymerase delta subunit 4
MPPKRASARNAGKATQSTLAFHGASNKVVKSNNRTATPKDILDKPVSKTPEVKVPDVASIPIPVEPEEATPEPATPEPATTKDADIIQQTEQEIAAQKVSSPPEDEEARRLSNAKIKQYWQAKEKERKVPRVHQQDLDLHEKILREFDMSVQYGVRVPDFRTL